MTAPRVLVTRPLPQAERTADKLRALGYEPVLAPMLRIVPVTPHDLPDFEKAQAVLVTSANGADRLAELTSNRSIRLLTVGDRTARAAEAAGFVQVKSAVGDGHALMDLARQTLSPDAGPVIHLRGYHAAVEFDGLGDLGYDFRDVISYEAVEDAVLPKSALHPLPTAGLLYSARTASVLVEAFRSARVDPAQMVFIGISAAALGPLSASGASLRVAKTPDEDAILDALCAAFPISSRNRRSPNR